MVNHAATILTAVPLSLPEQGYFRLGDELNFTGEMVTLAEYQEKMNAIDLNIEQEKWKMPSDGQMKIYICPVRKSGMPFISLVILKKEEITVLWEWIL